MADNSGLFPWEQGYQPETSSAGSGAYDWISGFGKSALESIPELVGITPSTNTQAWRQDHPFAGFASELLGTAVPYAGWFKLAKFIKPLEAAASAVSAGRSSFAAGALSTATKLAPFEAARVGASQAVGDQSLGNMTSAAITDLALGSGIGGLLHGISTAGTRDPSISSIFPGLDVSAPLPLQARAMREAIDSGQIADPDMLSRAKGKLNETLRDARIEELSPSQKYVGEIDPSAKSKSDPDQLERQLNRLFRSRDQDPMASTISVRRFAQGLDRDFSDKTTWQNEAKEAGLPDGFEEHGQYFRQISFNRFIQGRDYDEAERAAAKQSQTVNNVITKNMLNVGDNTFMTREADDGMFVLARKYEGDVKKGFDGDKWVLWKTDKPGYFLPGQQKWANAQVAIGKWGVTDGDPIDAGPVYNALSGFMKEFPLRNYKALGPDKEGIISKLLPDNVSLKDSQLASSVGNTLRGYLAPRIYQFKNYFRANYVQNAAKLAYDQADTTTAQYIYGVQKIEPGKNLFFNSLRKGEKPGMDGLVPIQQLVNGLTEENKNQFIEKIWRPRVPVTELQKLMEAGEISPETMQFAQAVDQAADHSWTTTNAVEEATGRKPTDPTKASYGMDRRWEGDNRFTLENDAGQVMAVAGGANRRIAQANAQRLLKENPTWRMGDEISLAMKPEEIVDFIRKKGLSPSTLNPLYDVNTESMRGFKWDLEMPTKKDLLSEFETSFGRRNKYQANLAVADKLTGQMEAVAKENPPVFNQLASRLNDMAGVQSDFGKWQNNVADKFLAPMLGSNSASKIVGATNTALFDFQLGAMRLSFPVTNGLQFMQTVIPEVAFVMGKAPPEDLAGRYSFFAAGGTKGPVGGMAVLNPIKMMASSLAEMRKPTQGLQDAFERAVNERVIEPRLVEEYMGQNATKMRDIRGVLKGDQSFVSWLRAMSEWLPAETERFSRTHAFTVGYQIGRDFLQKEGQALNTEQIYRFARQFTENTMYLYSAADRPKVFTTPAGSLMGLFKNWMFHYLSSMGEYTAQGFTKNNWAPLLWQTGGTAAIGGLAATPIWGAANEFSKLWSNKSLLQLSYEKFGDHSDAMLYGLPALLAGVSLTSGVDTPALSNPVRDGSSLFSIAAWGRAQALSKTVGAAFDHWQATGEHPAFDKNVKQMLVKSFAPTTIYRGMAALDPGGISSLGSGYPVVKDVSLMHKLLYTFGFNPVELQRAQDASQELYANHEKLKAEEKNLGKEWAHAEINSDGQKLSMLMRQGMTWGVDMSKVIKEGMYEIRKQQQTLIQRSIRPQEIAKFRAFLDLDKTQDKNEE